MPLKLIYNKNGWVLCNTLHAINRIVNKSNFNSGGITNFNSIYIANLPLNKGIQFIIEMKRKAKEEENEKGKKEEKIMDENLKKLKDIFVKSGCKKSFNMFLCL